MGALSTGVVEWAVASRTSTWEEELGDGYLVQPIEHGVLLAVVDGVGRGAEAAAATRLALRAIEHHAGEQLAMIFRRCHEAVRESRGVVASLATLDARVNAMTWIGVGGIEGMLCRADSGGAPRLERLVPRNGVVGRNLPAVTPASLTVGRGDLLILATDGVRAGFEQDVHPGATPASLAPQILSRHATAEDDALVLIASYRGGAA